MCFRWIVASLVLLLGAGGLLAADSPPATIPTTQAAEPAAPTVLMPEKVYQNLKAAIGSYMFGPQGEEDRTKDLAALDSLRKLPWPDLSKLNWQRLTSVRDSAYPAMSWCASISATEVVLVLPDLSVRRLERKCFTKIEQVDPALHLTALVDYLKHRKPGHQRPWDFTFIQDFGAGGLPYYSGVYLLHEAYAATWLGQEAQAQALVHAALLQHPLALAQAINDGAWQSFAKGIALLEDGQPRRVVLVQWQQTLQTYPTSRYREQLEDLIAQLTIQVREDKLLAQTPIVAPTTLPADQQVAYYIARLADVHGQQWSSPGHCRTLGMGKDTVASDALVKIGRPAVPVLMACLEDRRITRSFGFWRNYAPDRTVLRYQDVAVQGIDAIVDIPFYRPSSTSVYLSNEKPEVRAKVIANIKAWWRDYGQETPLQASWRG